jgi:hypothetical protein
MNVHLGALSLFAAACIAGFSAEARSLPTQSSMAGLPKRTTFGRGAPVPFIEYEAENALTNGEVIGPDRRFTTIAAEASGRKAVRLAGVGRFVEFILARRANALTVRYAVPDSVDGTGRDATLGVYVARARVGSLTTTSRYSWYYGDYPFTNHPGDGKPHHVFDEARLLLGRTLPAGTRVRLMVGEADTAAWYVIDLVDFELVAPPATRPARSVSVVEFGADPTGATDSRKAFQAAIGAAQAARRIVWIPPGTFRLNGHVFVDRVAIAGAGPWYTVLSGEGVGLYGGERGQVSRQVFLRDFAIFGEVGERDDRAPLAGIGGAMGGGSRIRNLWIQHVQAGVWMDGLTDGISIEAVRILNTSADGINFHRGVSHAVVENSFIRNTGDDGLAAWSGGAADHHLIFRRNTVIAPQLANGIAVYGGHDIRIMDNLVADTVTEGGGIHVGNRFHAVPVSARIDIENNLVVRSGSFDPHWRFGIGALWFYALDAPIEAGIHVRRLDLLDSSEDALLFVGKAIAGVRLVHVRISGGRHALSLRSAGSADFMDVRAVELSGALVGACNSAFRLRNRRGIPRFACKGSNADHDGIAVESPSTQPSSALR